MKRIFISIILVMFAMMSCGFSQTYFGKTTAGDWETLTLLIGAKTDTGYSNPIRAQFPIGTLKVYLSVDTVSSSDSLRIQLYESADNVVYKLITTPVFTTSTASNVQVVTLSNCPKFIKAMYYVMGASSRFYFTLKAVAKP